MPDEITSVADETNPIQDWIGKEAAKDGGYFVVKFITALAASPFVAHYLPLLGVTLSPTAAAKGVPILIGLLMHVAHDYFKKTYKLPWL